MKKIISLFIALVVLPLSLHAATYKEGVNYTVVKQTATEQPEVLEFFSYYCPHCKHFEPLMEALTKKLDKSVVVKKSHVNFMGGEPGKLLTRGLAAAQLLGVESEFKQVVLNIINNAKDVIDDKKITNGKIEIELDDKLKQISIKDNGGGIDEEILPKIFDPYFSTKDEKNGTGLGLYMSKTIVEDHHKGILNVKNSENGVIFEIILNKN